MPNFLQEDIYRGKSTLTFHEPRRECKNYLVPFRHCLAEPTPNDKLQDTTLFQIVDLRDITQSVLSMIEGLKLLIDVNESFQDRQRARTGPGASKKQNSKPRATIDSVNTDENLGQQGTTLYGGWSSSYRLTLQDCFGNTCYAYEVEPLGFLRKRSNGFFPIKLGSKIVVNSGTRIIFNTLQLKNENIEFLGGYIMKLDYRLYERKLKELKEEIHYEG